MLHRRNLAFRTIFVLNSDLWMSELLSGTFFQTVKSNIIPVHTSNYSAVGTASCSSGYNTEYGIAYGAVAGIYHYFNVFGYCWQSKVSAGEHWWSYAFSSPKNIRLISFCSHDNIIRSTSISTVSVYVNNSLIKTFSNSEIQNFKVLLNKKSDMDEKSVLFIVNLGGEIECSSIKITAQSDGTYFDVSDVYVI